MRYVAAIALAVLAGSDGAVAEPPTPEGVRAEIARVDGRIGAIERELEERSAKDARMVTARKDCERLEAIYTAYRSRLVLARDAANKAYRHYRKRFNQASWLGPCRARRLLFWLSDEPASRDWRVDAAVGHRYGPYAESFLRARQDFWNKRKAFQAEKRAVAGELQRNTELPSLGLGLFRDYGTFKDAYLERRAYCEGTVRRYFETRASFSKLQAEREGLRSRRAELEEDLSRMLGDARPPSTAADSTDAGPSLIELQHPRREDLPQVTIYDQSLAPQGLLVRAAVPPGTANLEPGRLYRLVARLGARSYSLYGRVRAPTGGAEGALVFAGILPARLGDFELRVSIPELPDLGVTTMRGTLVHRPDAMQDVEEAMADLAKAKRPRGPGGSPDRVQRDLCEAHTALARALMRCGRVDASIREAKEAGAILEKRWPASRAWRTGVVGSRAWYVLSCLFAQRAYLGGDMKGLERIYEARSAIYEQIVAEDGRGVSEANAVVHLRNLRAVYRRQAEAYLLLENDLARARRHWKRGRMRLHPSEEADAAKARNDPVWYQP